MNRRDFIIGGASLASATFASAYTLNSLFGKDKVRMTIGKAEIYVPGHNATTKIRHIVPYAEFSGSVFMFVPMKAKKGEGVLSLIHRANEIYNPDVKIKGDLADRALELFSIVYKNQSPLKTLEEGKISDFYFKKAPVPDIKPDVGSETYQVPVLPMYKSLEEVIKPTKK